MRDRAIDAVKKLGRAFGAFTTGQKAVTLVGIVAIVAGGFVFAKWASAPSYAPLFSNLSSTDASAIVDKLNSGGTQYQLADGGATIMVPQSQVYDLRLKMSGQGLPAQTDTGYALLDKQGLTTSDFMQNVGYQRALEGELDKTIKSISGVQAAAVHLALPQKDVFATDAQKPTASVLVTTSMGKTLSSDQVQSVIHLVAASVVGLDPNQVTVADAAGNVLSTGNGQTTSSAASGRNQQTQQYEQRMNDALQQMLNSVVGTGHAVVKTTADLDYDQTETKTQTYVAPSPSTPPLSQSTNVESYSGTGTTTGGVLGPDNIQVPNGGGNGSYSHSTNTQDNAVGMVTETRNSSPGNVRRLSVAVLLDSSTAKSVDLAAVQKLVSSAVALDAKRGDTIAVSAMPFDESAAEKAKQTEATASKAEAQAQIMSMAKTGGMALGILVLVLLAWRASRRSRNTALTAGETAALDRIQAVLEKRDTPALGEGGGTEALALGAGSAGPDADALALEARHHEISEMVEQQPDEVAQLLRGWLAERRG
ncbi:MAG: flagellar M-ring protein FliF [Actinobacteria bacterium 13_2_20CM_2_72_6]|nr:MAG: flagellar M-ring protein FliF [Actinobacteria bacterium 13_2_20CM_2_72_6]